MSVFTYFKTDFKLFVPITQLFRSGIHLNNLSLYYLTLDCYSTHSFFFFPLGQWGIRAFPLSTPFFLKSFFSDDHIQLYLLFYKVMLHLGEQASSDKKQFNFINFTSDLFSLHSSSEHLGEKNLET